MKHTRVANYDTESNAIPVNLSQKLSLFDAWFAGYKQWVAVFTTKF